MADQPEATSTWPEDGRCSSVEVAATMGPERNWPPILLAERPLSPFGRILAAPA